MEFLKNNRNRIEDDLIKQDTFYLFSASSYSCYQVLKSILATHARGRLIDIGCGKMPYKKLLGTYIETYDTLDVKARTAGVTYECDVHDLSVIPSETYDSAICLEVLEHLADPFKAVREIARIIKKGGVVIFSAPHLSRIHEAPHDYFRYTPFGLRKVIEASGLSVLEIKQHGGLLCFLGHQVSSGLLCLTWHVPLVKPIVFFLNEWLLVRPLSFFDRKVFRSALFASGFVAVARKNIVVNEPHCT